RLWRVSGSAVCPGTRRAGCSRRSNMAWRGLPPKRGATASLIVRPAQKRRRGSHRASSSIGNGRKSDRLRGRRCPRALPAASLPRLPAQIGISRPASGPGRWFGSAGCKREIAATGRHYPPPSAGRRWGNVPSSSAFAGFDLDDFVSFFAAVSPLPLSALSVLPLLLGLPPSWSALAAALYESLR